MPSSDIRIVGWDLPASAGKTYELEFTSSEALTSLSLYVGGTLDDVDDLTGATEYAATLSGGNLVATVQLDVPSGTSASVLRLVVDGAVITVGYLRPSAGGVKPSSPTTFNIAPSTYEFTLNVNGIVISTDGAADHGALTGLGDDDHTQYALADGSRGAFATTGHDHDLDYESAGAVASHEADTTSVHGIADTSQLIVEGDSRLTDARTPTAHTHDDRYYTESEVDTALAGKSDTSHNHAGVYDPAGTASSAVAAHEADTTSIHGIADTSALLDNSDIGTTVQAHDADLDTIAAANNGAVLAATTASFTTADETKLDGIEDLADVTDATNVAAAGAVMEADTSTASMSFVVDEDDMTSNSATKLPTQQSVKAYVDNATSSAVRHDGTPAVGDWLKVKSVSPLVVERADEPSGGGGSADGNGGSGERSGQYYEPFIAGLASASMTLNRVFYAPFLFGAPVTLDRIAINVQASAASTVVRLGIYEDDNGLPGNLLLDAGTVDVSTTGLKEIAISQAVSATWYWLCAVAQGSADPSLRGSTGGLIRIPSGPSATNAMSVLQSPLGAAPGALPATASVQGGGSTAKPNIAVRIA